VENPVDVPDHFRDDHGVWVGIFDDSEQAADIAPPANHEELLDGPLHSHAGEHGDRLAGGSQLVGQSGSFLGVNDFERDVP